MKEVQIGVQLKCDDLSESKLQALTREMLQSLKKARLGPPTLPEIESKGEAKGDPVSLGTILLALVGSHGVAVSLAQVLKAYVDRKPSWAVELKRHDGTSLKLKAENLHREQFEHTTKIVEEFLKS